MPDKVNRLGRLSPPYWGDPWTMERDVLDDAPILFSVVQSAGDWILLEVIPSMVNASVGEMRFILWA